VRFQGLCDGRGYPLLRIGVTDNNGVLEVQDQFSIGIDELQTAFRGTMSNAFGSVIGQ
jgi:phosphoribosylformylglycinamidine synthase